MSSASTQRDAIGEIPSPTYRLWLGLFFILATFGFFAYYTAGKINRLERYQLNVVQRNRKSSLQLLRMQNDSYLLALLIRDMEVNRAGQSLTDWKPSLNRLLEDMEDAARLEAQFAVASAPGNALRDRLRADLAGLGQSSGAVFTLDAHGHGAQARAMVGSELEQQRADLTAIVVRLLRMNFHAQVVAGRKISAVYSSVKRDVLLVTGLLSLLALATGFYVLQANRRTFAKLHHLAEQLNDQSHQLRELSWRLIDLQEQTLRQVARDLHDEFGQILTAVGLALKRAERHGAGSEMQQELENARGIVQETLENVRGRSQIFRPAILDDFGLTQALDGLARQFSEQANISVHFDARGVNGEFAPSEAIHLYRIVQEALNNVARHSHASEAWVTLEAQGDELEIQVRDNGSGFDMQRANARSPRLGLGLLSMRERAEHLNGTLSVQSSPQKGTAVTARVPLKPSEAKKGV